MRFSVATVLAFAAAVLAQTDGFNVITKPKESEKVPAGSTYEVVWQPGPEKYTGPVTIALVGGATQQTLSTIETLASKFARRTSRRGRRRVVAYTMSLQRDMTEAAESTAGPSTSRMATRPSTASRSSGSRTPASSSTRSPSRSRAALPALPRLPPRAPRR